MLKKWKEVLTVETDGICQLKVVETFYVGNVLIDDSPQFCFEEHTTCRGLKRHNMNTEW